MSPEELREALIFGVIRLYIARTPEIYIPESHKNSECWSVYIVTVERGIESSCLLFEDENRIKIFRSIDDAYRYLEQTLDISIPAFSVNNPGLKAEACPCTRQPGIPGTVPRL